MHGEICLSYELENILSKPNPEGGEPSHRFPIMLILVPIYSSYQHKNVLEEERSLLELGEMRLAGRATRFTRSSLLASICAIRSWLAASSLLVSASNRAIRSWLAAWRSWRAAMLAASSLLVSASNCAIR